MKTVVNIVTGGTLGLKKDAEIIKEIIGDQFEVNIHVSRERNVHLIFQRIKIVFSDLIFPKNRILIFLENIPTVWLPLSKKRIFIPNQEWMRENTLSNFKKCNEIWCKTQYSKSIFSNLFNTCKFIGFTSSDVFLNNVEKNYSSFIHIAGRSHLKGTGNILQLWKQYPDLPNLTIISTNKDWEKNYPLANVRYITHILDWDKLKNEMNRNGIHLCISETEGFGHYIAEALSCKSVVISTNAPPMNELVNNNSGILVETNGKEEHGLGDQFYIDQKDFEEKIMTVLRLTETEKATLGEAARMSYLEQKLAFEKKLYSNLQEFLLA